MTCHLSENTAKLAYIYQSFGTSCLIEVGYNFWFTHPKHAQPLDKVPAKLLLQIKLLHVCQNNLNCLCRTSCSPIFSTFLVQKLSQTRNIFDTSHSLVEICITFLSDDKFRVVVCWPSLVLCSSFAFKAFSLLRKASSLSHGAFLSFRNSALLSEKVPFYPISSFSPSTMLLSCRTRPPPYRRSPFLAP
jgi:hypothetical protein